MGESIKKPESIVIDTNVLVSSLVKREGYTQALLSILLAQREMKLVVPETIKDETERHLNEISRKSGLPPGVLRELMAMIFKNVDTVKEASFIPEIRDALGMVSDKSDAPFAGLALKLSPAIILTYNKRHFRRELLGTRDVMVLEPGELAEHLDMTISVDRKVRRKGGILKLISRLYLLKSGKRPLK